MNKTALIIGATGATGKLLTQKLIQSNVYSKIYVVHKKGTEFKEQEKVQEVIGSFEKLQEMLLPITNVDDVFSCIGSTLKKAGSKEQFYKIDCNYVVTLGQWARDIKAQSVHVISYFGADPKAIHYYNRTKGLMEDGLKQLKLNALYIYHPPLLTGRSNLRIGEFIGFLFLKLFQPLFIGKLRKYRPLNVAKLAEYMYVGAQEQPKRSLRIIGSIELQGYQV